jgi:ABC-type proline/glycine betaine transport system substrate-binding protein
MEINIFVKYPIKFLQEFNVLYGSEMRSKTVVKKKIQKREAKYKKVNESIKFSQDMIKPHRKFCLIKSRIAILKMHFFEFFERHWKKKI